MAFATTYAHFAQIPVQIPNVSTSGADQDALIASISKLEPEFLKAILGYELYTLYTQGVENLTAKYLLIKNGSSYTDVNGVLTEWQGFTAGSNPIANYVYWQHVRDLQRSLTGAGATQSKSENSDLVSAAQLMIDAWNEMVDFNINLHNFLYANESDYPEYIGFTASPPRYRNAMIPGYANQQLFIKQNIYGF